MSGGGQASDVYWHIADAATMTDSTVLGTILAGAAITQTRGSFNGRALTNLAGDDHRQLRYRLGNN